MTCGFEAYDTQCDDMIDIFVTGDDIDPIYNTGNGLQTDLLKVIQHQQLRSVLASVERFGMMFGINCSAHLIRISNKIHESESMRPMF